MKSQAILRGISSALKIVVSVANYFSPYGQAIGGALSLGGGVMDVLTPHRQPLSFKEINPSNYIDLQNKK